MAELLKIKSKVKDFQQEYVYRNGQAEETRQKENQAATRIQSWFRACKVRAYLSYLHKKAIIIQKIWRGFTARARFRQMVKAAYFIMKMNFYEEMAVRIQRRWRGFFVRKYIHNFYARKSYLEGLLRKNELVSAVVTTLEQILQLTYCTIQQLLQQQEVNKDIHERRAAMVERVRACLHACPAITLHFYAKELDELEELQRRERDCLEMVKEQIAKVNQAQRLHHLLSTKQCPGVFNSPFRPAPHEMEQLLRQVKYQAPTRLAPWGRACLLGMPGPAAPSFPGTPESPWIKTTRTCCSSRPVLPPIASKKQQPLSWSLCHRRRDEEDWPLVLAGLFREPGKVWEQHVHCPDLTLRLQTSHTRLEEVQNQLRQHEFMGLHRGTLGTGSLLHHLSDNSNSFTQPAYTKSFR